MVLPLRGFKYRILRLFGDGWLVKRAYKRRIVEMGWSWQAFFEAPLDDPISHDIPPPVRLVLGMMEVTLRGFCCGSMPAVSTLGDATSPATRSSLQRSPATAFGVRKRSRSMPAERCPSGSAVSQEQWPFGGVPNSDFQR